MDLGPVDYTAAPPATYCCSRCEASSVKLWRQYQTFADSIELLCGSCALADQKTDGPIDAGGHIDYHGVPCGQIGWLVPAVPTEDGATYWGYTAVPQPGVVWWRHIPTGPLERAP